MSPAESFDRAIEANHRALDQIAKGDPSGFFELYSDSQEATLRTRSVPRCEAAH